MEFASLLLSAANGQYPLYGVTGLLAIGIMLLFAQLSAIRTALSTTKSESSERFGAVENGVAEVRAAHERTTETLAKSFATFQIEMARTTPSRDEMDKRILDTNASQVQLLENMRDDLTLLKGVMMKR